MTTTLEPMSPGMAAHDVPSEFRLGPDFVPKARYVSQEFLCLEIDRLFPKVWLAACREEELFDVGDYVEFSIGDQSMLIVRDQSMSIRAFFNACRHRGTRLAEGCGALNEIRCPFHGWRWNLDGSNKRVLDPLHFASRTEEDLALNTVLVDTWGGWVFINMDPNAEPLLDFLDPIPTKLGPCQFEKMRYKWYKRTVLPANWKTVQDAFIEAYHATATHPQVLRIAAWQPMPSHITKNHSFLGMPGTGPPSGSGSETDTPGLLMLTDPAAIVAMVEANACDFGRMPDFESKAARELTSTEVPEGVPALMHFMALRRKYAEEAGIAWTELSIEQMFEAAPVWSMFPNMALTAVDPYGAIVFRVRPKGMDPDACLFEAYVLERPPERELDQKRRVEIQDIADFTQHEHWGRLLDQDFANLGHMTAGMHSRGFDGHVLSPVQEGCIYNHHVVADRYLWA